MVENCHWGSRRPYEPTATWCPWNFYRTSGDVRATYGSVIGNLQSVFKFSGRNLSCAAESARARARHRAHMRIRVASVWSQTV